jgi:hypothetical protein
LPKPKDFEQITTTAEEKWAAYNRRMADLFSKRDEYPVNSPEREAAAKAILALWVAVGD